MDPDDTTPDTTDSFDSFDSFLQEEESGITGGMCGESEPDQPLES